MSASPRFDSTYAMKAALWEETKGKLRALVAIQGSYHSMGEHTHEGQRFAELKAEVERFIEYVNDNALAD